MDLVVAGLEELKVGDTDSFEQTISRAAINQFAEMTADRHPLHTDAAYAVAHGFKDIIAHGLLIASYSSALIGMRMPGRKALVMTNAFTFREPAYPDDILTYTGEITSVFERMAFVDIKVTVTNQNDATVAMGNYKVKIRDDG